MSLHEREDVPNVDISRLVPYRLASQGMRACLDRTFMKASDLIAAPAHPIG